MNYSVSRKRVIVGLEGVDLKVITLEQLLRHMTVFFSI
jgi:hypothetical protein